MKAILALLPDESVAKRLESISQTLCGSNKTYVLGLNSLAHNSVLQFEAEEAELESIWKSVSQLKITQNIEAKRFYTDVMTDRSAMYFGIGIKLTSELSDFQVKMANTLGSRKYINNVGISYFPHYTLGCFPKGHDATLKTWETDFNLPAHNAVLAMGVGGANWQFEKLLYKRN